MTAMTPFVCFLLDHPAMTGDSGVVKGDEWQSVLEFYIGIDPEDHLFPSLKRRSIAAGN